MKGIKTYLFKLFQFVYTYSSPKFKRLLVSGIKKTLDPPNSTLRRKIKYLGKFRVVYAGSGFWIRNTGGPIENDIFWNGMFSSWERDCSWIWAELCEVSNTIFDVGANIGLYSLVAQAKNPKAKIYAFEPSKQVFGKLRANVELNKFPIDLQRLAVSNSSNKAVIFYDLPDQHQTTASLSPEKMKNTQWYKGDILEYTVPTITLSDFIEQHKVSSIDLMKIDIEMHEPEALEGMGDYLEHFKPVIFLEVLTEKIAEKLNELIPVQDYFIFRLRNSQTAEPVPRFDVFDDTYKKHEWNFLLFHRGIESKVRENTSLFDNIYLPTP